MPSREAVLILWMVRVRILSFAGVLFPLSFMTHAECSTSPAWGAISLMISSTGTMTPEWRTFSHDVRSLPSGS